MGQAKLLLPVKGRSLVEYALESALASSDRVVVVTGWYSEELETVLAPYVKKWKHHMHVVHNRHAEKGQFSSTQVGVAQVDPSATFTIAVADSPMVTPYHYHQLEPLLHDHAAVRPYCNGIPGHPVLCAPFLRDIILGLPVSATMRDLLAAQDVARLDTDDPVWITDIDTPDAYQQFIDSLPSD
jgi:molybdenum cofactor cytidylyltransferase